jgi:two-component system response regulator CpxR
MHISHLRKKLGHRIGEVERIKTVRGVGYIYARITGAEDGKALGV